MVTTPALEHLVGAYLNEDVFDFYKNPMAAVEAFIADEPDAPQLPSEIEHVLATYQSDPDLEKFLEGLGLGLILLEDEGTYRAWLAGIAHRVESELGESA